MIRKMILALLLLATTVQAQSFTVNIKRTRYGSSASQYAPISIPRNQIVALTDSGTIFVHWGGWSGIQASSPDGHAYVFTNGGGSIVDTFDIGLDNATGDHDHIVQYETGDTILWGRTNDGASPAAGYFSEVYVASNNISSIRDYSFASWSTAIGNRATYRMAPFFITGTDSVGFLTRGGSTAATAPWNVMYCWSADFGATWDVTDTVRLANLVAEASQCRVGSYNFPAIPEPFVSTYENTGTQALCLYKWNRATQAFSLYGDTVFGGSYVSERGFDFIYGKGKVFAVLVNDDYAQPDSIFYAVRDTSADSNWVRNILALDPAGASSQFGFLALSATQNDSIVCLTYMRSVDFSDNFLLCGRYWDFSTSQWSAEFQIAAATTTTNCMQAVGTVPTSHGNTIYTTVNYLNGSSNQMEIDEITFTGTGAVEPPPETPSDTTNHDVGGVELGGVEI